MEILNQEVEFWKETAMDGRIRIDIVNSKFIKFLEGRGYRKLVKKNNFQLVKIVEESIIKPTEIFQIRDEIKSHLKRLDREDVWEEFLQTDYLAKRITEGIESVTIDFNYGDEDTAIFFYQNGVLKVSASHLEMVSYPDYEGYVWEEQILKRPFLKSNSEDAEFRIFCDDLSKNQPERLLSLQSIVGFMLHSYKDPALARATILMDEIIDLEGSVSEGGTGKSLMADAIGRMVPCLRKDGKNLKSDNRFFFSNVEPHHKILVFDDVKADFDFESLYSMITGELPIEKKYKNPVVIDFKDAPKVMITSNYIVRGTGGNSEDRRKVEFEVSPYYRIEQTIMEKFGHRFFDDWFPEEWMKFDNFMIECVQIFLNNGIIEPNPINLQRNRLVMDTHPKFIIFIESALETPSDYDGEEVNGYMRFNKTSLFRKFVRTNPECSTVSPILFKKWIDRYSNIKGIEVDHSKSNSLSIVKFKK